MYNTVFLRNFEPTAFIHNSCYGLLRAVLAMCFQLNLHLGLFMKKHSLALFATVLLASGAVHAQTVTSPFQVTVTLAQKCIADSTNGTPVIAFGTYNAFDPAISNVAASGPISFLCTRGLAPISTLFDAAGGGTNGLLSPANLRYTLVLAAPTVGTGTAATTADIGTADKRSFTFTGTLLGNQAGNTAGNGVVSTDNRTLVLTF
jgi:hypothetical protein